MQKNKTTMPLAIVCILGMLIALEIVLERIVAINVLTFKINLAFIPMALAAYLYGPIGGALVYGLGDVIGTLLFPAGAYNPLFTLTNVLIGLLYGFCLRGNLNPLKISIGPILSRTLGTLGLNTLWIYLFFIKGKKGYIAFLLTRVPEAAIMLAAELIILIPLFLGCKNWLNHLKYSKR